MSKVAKRQHAVNIDRTRAGDALSRLVVQVFSLDGALTATGDGLARPAGQTTARWRVLAAVQREPLSVAQIARAWSLARQSVQRIADALEHDGLVTYEDNPGHRRAKLVQLTPKGATALEQIQAAQRAWANELGGKIGAADLQTASDVLDRVLELLAQRPAEA
jgi:DNA-binding MarR family transcriptional regulator